MSLRRSLAMSRHEGVSCDSCMKSNFTSLRYKCLVCYDYDLCAPCHDSGATSSRHTVDHPMQCILTRTDLNMYYGGENSASMQTQSYTCSYCGQMGFTVALLLDHLKSSHANNMGTVSVEVVCPVCAVMPSGDPNHVTDDLFTHITRVHRTTTAADFEEETLASTRHIRRLTHPTRAPNPVASSGNSVSSGSPAPVPASASSVASRASRMMQLIELPSLPGTGLSAAIRDPIDPVAELLSQLSSVRSRALAGAPYSLAPHYSQLEVQPTSVRLHTERLPGQRTADQSNKTQSSSTTSAVAASSSSRSATADSQQPSATSRAPTSATANRSRFLLNRISERSMSEAELVSREVDHADHSLFVQELLLALMSEPSDGVRLGPVSTEEPWSSLEDVSLSDCDGLLSKSVDSQDMSSHPGSMSSLGGVQEDVDPSSGSSLRPAENCESVSKESFGVGVENCTPAGGGIDVACTKAGVS